LGDLKEGRKEGMEGGRKVTKERKKEGRTEVYQRRKDGMKDRRLSKKKRRKEGRYRKVEVGPQEVECYFL
jgi:hypothetical protein